MSTITHPYPEMVDPRPWCTECGVYVSVPAGEAGICPVCRDIKSKLMIAPSPEQQSECRPGAILEHRIMGAHRLFRRDVTGLFWEEIDFETREPTGLRISCELIIESGWNAVLVGVGARHWAHQDVGSSRPCWCQVGHDHGVGIWDD